jgi:hypothetical protein
LFEGGFELFDDFLRENVGIGEIVELDNSRADSIEVARGNYRD